MREIKFRAWHKKKKKMFNVDTIHNLASTGLLWVVPCPWEYHESNNAWNIDEIELMQFTWLYDKNGKEIFEGDIVQWVSHKGCKEILIKAGVAWGICGFWTQGWLNKLDMNYSNMEVIGNIYENSELMKKK